MAATIKLRRDTAANWTSADPTLASGELGIETDTNKVKIGTGVDAWTVLPYFADASALSPDIVDALNGANAPDSSNVFATINDLGTFGNVSKVGTPANNQVGVWTGDGTIEGDVNLTFDTATDTLATVLITATTVTANLTGNISGNAATVTTNANLTGDVTSVGNATTIAAGAVDIAMLSATGTPDNTTYLRGDNTWSTVAAGATTALDNLSAVAINAALVLGTSDAFALGSATKQWSDLFLAEGGVINWDNGDMTLTQTGNVLAVAGGVLDVPTSGLSINSTAVTSTGTQINYLNAATGTTGTTSTNLVFSTSPTLVTPVLGVATATSINKVDITAPATSATLTIADGKTLTASNTITFTATDGSTLAIGAGGTLGSNAYTSTAYAPIASPTFTGTITIPTPFTLGATSVTSTGTQLNYLSAATGTTGTTSTNIVFSTSPTLVTPVLGVATATSINKVTITAPATSSTLTVADGSSLITSGAFALTLTSSATSNATIPAGTNTLYSTKSGSITSAELATSLTDETGTGVAVFGTSPTITTPTFSGTITTSAAAQTGTNASGVGGIPYVHHIFVRSDETLANSNADQNLFTNTAHDVITVLANTTYRFEGAFDLTHGATSHSLALGFTPTTATVTNISYNGLQWVTAVGTQTASQTSFRTKATATTVINSAGANATESVIFWGWITIGNTGGTITPQIKFSADPTGTVLLKAGSEFHIWAVGNDTFTEQGPIA